MLLDAGPSMRAPLRERVASSKLSGKRDDSDPKTRFDAAVAAVEGLLQQKVRSLDWIRIRDSHLLTSCDCASSSSSPRTRSGSSCTARKVRLVLCY